MDITEQLGRNTYASIRGSCKIPRRTGRSCCRRSCSCTDTALRPPRRRYRAFRSCCSRTAGTADGRNSPRCTGRSKAAGIPVCIHTDRCLRRSYPSRRTRRNGKLSVNSVISIFKCNSQLLVFKGNITVADVGGVESLVVRSVESRLTFVAVDALRVVTAVLADAAAFVIAVDVQRLTPLLHFVVEFALLRVTETMTG